jgi:hypothetical protein
VTYLPSTAFSFAYIQRKKNLEEYMPPVAKHPPARLHDHAAKAKPPTVHKPKPPTVYKPKPVSKASADKARATKIWDANLMPDLPKQLDDMVKHRDGRIHAAGLAVIVSLCLIAVLVHFAWTVSAGANPYIVAESEVLPAVIIICGTGLLAALYMMLTGYEKVGDVYVTTVTSFIIFVSLSAWITLRPVPAASEMSIRFPSMKFTVMFAITVSLALAAFMHNAGRGFYLLDRIRAVTEFNASAIIVMQTVCVFVGVLVVVGFKYVQSLPIAQSSESGAIAPFMASVTVIVVALLLFNVLAWAAAQFVDMFALFRDYKTAPNEMNISAPPMPLPNSHVRALSISILDNAMHTMIVVMGLLAVGRSMASKVKIDIDIHAGEAKHKALLVFLLPVLTTLVAAGVTHFARHMTVTSPTGLYSMFSTSLFAFCIVFVGVTFVPWNVFTLLTLLTVAMLMSLRVIDPRSESGQLFNAVLAAKVFIATTTAFNTGLIVQEAGILNNRARPGDTTNAPDTPEPKVVVDEDDKLTKWLLWSFVVIFPASLVLIASLSAASRRSRVIMQVEQEVFGAATSAGAAKETHVVKIYAMFIIMYSIGAVIDNEMYEGKWFPLISRTLPNNTSGSYAVDGVLLLGAMVMVGSIYGTIRDRIDHTTKTSGVRESSMAKSGWLLLAGMATTGVYVGVRSTPAFLSHVRAADNFWSAAINAKK